MMDILERGVFRFFSFFTIIAWSILRVIGEVVGSVWQWIGFMRGK